MKIRNEAMFAISDHTVLYRERASALYREIFYAALQC